MSAILFVAVAAIFTAVRAVLTADQPGAQIPWRTFGVNMGGAFAMGYLTTTGTWDDPWIVSIAGLGSLTTFSTVAAEATGLIDDDERGRALVYVGLTVVVGVLAAFIGLTLGDST